MSGGNPIFSLKLSVYSEGNRHPRWENENRPEMVL